MMGLGFGLGLTPKTSPAVAGGGNTHAYRYYRLYVTAVATAGNPAGLVEIEIAATAGGADTTAGKTYSANSEFPGETADKAYDDNTGTNWGGLDGTMPQWNKVDYGASSGGWIAANQFKITSRAGAPDQAPKDFLWQGSDDDSAWTTLITVTGAVFSSGGTNTYVVP